MPYTDIVETKKQTLKNIESRLNTPSSLKEEEFEYWMSIRMTVLKDLQDLFAKQYL